MLEETEANIRLLEDIRDDSEELPAVRLQAIQTLQKMIEPDDLDTEWNIKTLKELRNSDKTSNGIKVQVVQTLEKILKIVEGDAPDDKPTTESIMKQIRGEK